MIAACEGWSTGGTTVTFPLDIGHEESHNQNMTTTQIMYDEGPNSDSVEFPWCIVEDGGISDRFATRSEAELAAVTK